MGMKPKRPLLWICFIICSCGLICNYLALILPYWYAKFPNSKNRFLRLGLWEICLNHFMPATLGNVMYDGCFYLYDSKLNSMKPRIIRNWFIVCQIFYTCSFISYLLTAGIFIMQISNLYSPRGPRSVLFIMLSCSTTCLFLPIALITMGAGVDVESKRKPLRSQDWLQSLDQSSLSWSFGLAAFSLLGSFLVLLIIGWFVYPKHSPGGLLSVAAWDWPTADDWLCRYHMQDLHVSTERTRSRSFVSAENQSHSVVSSYQVPLSERPSVPPQSSTFRQPTIRTSFNNRHAGKDTRQHSVEMESFSGKLSSYDPRTPEMVSFNSYEQLISLHNQPSTMQNGQSAAPLRQFSRRSSNHRIEDDVDSRQLISETPHRSVDTSVWTADSQPIQVGRPMTKRSRNARRKDLSDKSALSHHSSTLLDDYVPEMSSEVDDPPAPVQAARKMQRVR